MRLRNIYIVCRDNLAVIDNLQGSTISNNTAYTQVYNWQETADAIRNQLLSIEFLKRKAQKLIDSVPEIFRTSNTFKIANSDWNKINNAKIALMSCMIDVIELYESMGLEAEEQTGLDIKLPKCNDFSDLKKYIDELEFILYKCPFFRNETESLQFQTVDVGSLWLNFAIVGASIGVASVLANNIVAFIDKCLIVKSHKKTLEQQELMLKSIEMDVKAKEATLDGLKKIYEAQVNVAVTELEQETNITLNDGEERGRVEQAFEKMSTLLDKGMQLYATIDSPEEVKVLFEPIETKYLSIGESLKLLEDNEEE